MKRSMLLENLQHIHENLCFKSGINPSKPYKRMWPINFTNKKYNHAKTVAASFL